MLIISKIHGSVFSQISRNQARLIQFPRGYLRTFARQRVLQPGVSRLTVARGHPLNGGTSLVLADIASTRVAHDARVDPHRRLSRPSVKRRPSNRPTGPRSCRWRIWLCNREPIRINSGEQRIKQWKNEISRIYYRPCTNNGWWLRSSWLRLRLHVRGSAIRILE